MNKIAEAIKTTLLCGSWVAMFVYAFLQWMRII